MHTLFSIEECGRITAITFHEKPGFETVKAAMDQALEKGTCVLRLWDFSIGTQLSKQDILAIATRGRTMWPEPSRGAIIAQDDLSFGLMRMHDVYRERELQETRTFRTRNAGIEWLNACWQDMFGNDS